MTINRATAAAASIMSLAFAGAIGAIFYQTKTAPEQPQTKTVNQIFAEAGVPAGQEHVIAYRLFQQSGDCDRLGETLGKACEKAKLALNTH